VKITPEFFDGIRELIPGARATVARGMDLVQVHTNFEIGRRIAQEEQRDKGRAAFGDEIIKALADRLTGEFGKGFPFSNIKWMRLFYLRSQHRIGQTLSGQFDVPSIGQTLTDQLAILQALTGKSEPPQRPSTMSANYAKPTRDF
jgi:hypothetical protein